MKYFHNDVIDLWKITPLPVSYQLGSLFKEHGSCWLFGYFPVSVFLFSFFIFSITPSAVSSTKDPIEPHWFVVVVLPSQVFLIQGSLGLDCTLWIPDSSSVELWLRIPIVSRIPNFLCCIPDSKSQDSGFHTLKSSLIPLYGTKF